METETNLEKRSAVRACNKQTVSFRFCDERWLHRMNEACNHLIENGGCKHECMGIGYCAECYKIERDTK